MESKINEIGQMASKFNRMSLNDQTRKPFYCSNCGQEGYKKNNCPQLVQQGPVTKSNFTQRYFPPIEPIQCTPPDSDGEENDGVAKVACQNLSQILRLVWAEFYYEFIIVSAGFRQFQHL